jgi:hypothetical protein
MAKQASEFHRGEMDVHEQVKTYEFVMSMTKWGSLTIASFLLFITLWFCTPAGFLGALATGVVAAVIGFLVLRGGGEGH